MTTTTTRVFFEEADRPPPSYFDAQNGQLNSVPLKKVPFQTPDPEKWINAPEFVPRSKLLAETFGPPPPPHFAPPMPMRSVAPLDGIPPGYTANMTTINPSNGPPIAAILLRKKRKRRQKSSNTNSMVLNHSTSPCSSHPSDPNDCTSEEDQQTHPNLSARVSGGSCPDLTEQQIQKWDDYLFETVQTHKKKMDHDDIFEVPSAAMMNVARETLTGTKNKELQQWDCSNALTSSMVLKRLADHTFISDGSTEKTLADELNDLTFRPEITRYGYPQIDCDTSPYVHIASMDPKDKKVKNSLIDKAALKAYLDEEAEEEEDYLEGLNIRVNNFDTCDDLTLSDVETPSRFQQIQDVIRKNTIVMSNDLGAPERQCCLIM